VSDAPAKRRRGERGKAHPGIKPKPVRRKIYTPAGGIPCRILLAEERAAHQRTKDAMGRFAEQLAVIMDELFVVVGLPEVRE
jgi:hypothetical protein